MTTPIKKASYIRNMGTCGAALIIAGIGPWGWNCRPTSQPAALEADMNVIDK